jgi:hypothetical protein
LSFAGTFWQDGTGVRARLSWNNADNGSFGDVACEGSVQCDSRAVTLRTVNIDPQAGGWANGATKTTLNGSFSPDFASLTGTLDAFGCCEFTAHKR